MHPEPHDHEPDEVPHTHPDPGVDPHQPLVTGARALRIGIGGPVGSGKTALVAALCRTLGAELRLAVVTNDIYTTEDADFLLRNGVLPADRIRAVETGCCPHTAIRDDISANLDAVEDLETSLGPLDLVLVESGGDNLTATFSKGLIDRQIFVIDVAGGDKVPRKGGPGVTAADLLVINKIDLAPLVGADLSVMDRDAAARRGALPTVFLSLVQDRAATPVADWIRALITARNPVAGNPAADAPAADVPSGSLPTSNTQATSYPASNAQAPSYPADSAQATSYPASGAQATSLPASGAQASSLPASGAQATSLPASGAQATGLPAADISAAG